MTKHPKYVSKTTAMSNKLMLKGSKEENLKIMTNEFQSTISISRLQQKQIEII